MRPPSRSRPPKVSVYAVNAHWREASLMCSAFCACGSAMFTIEASRMIMSWATPMTARASQRRSRPAAWGAGAVTVAVVMCLPICLRNGGGGLTLGTEADAASGKHTGGTLRFVNGFPVKFSPAGERRATGDGAGTAGGRLPQPRPVAGRGRGDVRQLRHRRVAGEHREVCGGGDRHALPPFPQP